MTDLLAHKSLCPSEAAQPLIMGVVNTTPDSFSDGGSYRTTREAADAGLRMIDEGADLIDVGGESTRPGAHPIAVEQEVERAIPVVERLCRVGVRVSIDTYKAEVAKRALEVGAEVVNDVTAFRDPDMAGICARAGCTVCLMHMQGTPETMQSNPRYENVVGEIRSFLLQGAAYAESAGIRPDRIWIDPGIGFGKTVEHNLEILRNLREFTGTGYPVLIGVSRKGFIGRILAEDGTPAPIDDRLPGSLAVQVVAQLAGVHVVRTHDVHATRSSVKIIAELIRAPQP